MNFVERIKGIPGIKYNSEFLKLNNGFIDDEEISSYSDNLLHNLRGRTSLIFDMVDYQLPNVSLTHLVGDSKDKVLKVSAISPEFSISQDDGDEADLKLVRHRDGCALLQLVTEPEKWASARVHSLEKALAFNPDVIVFPELSYPVAHPNMDSGWTIEGLTSYGEQRKKFEGSVIDKMIEFDSKAFVFLGSYHCPYTLYNVGVVLPLGPEKRSFTATRVREHLSRDGNEDEPPRQMRSPIIYRKRFPARRVGESTRVPPSFEFQTFNRDNLCIATLVCSDVVDLNQFLAIARRNNDAEKYNPIDLIIIPAFNESEKLISMVQELTFIASTTAIFVNVDGAMKGRPSRVFSCGFNETQLLELGQLNDCVFIEVKDEIVLGLPERVVIQNFVLYLTGLDRIRDRLQKVRLGTCGDNSLGLGRLR